MQVSILSLHTSHFFTHLLRCNRNAIQQIVRPYSLSTCSADLNSNQISLGLEPLCPICSAFSFANYDGNPFFLFFFRTDTKKKTQIFLAGSFHSLKRNTHEFINKYD